MQSFAQVFMYFGADEQTSHSLTNHILSFLPYQYLCVLQQLNHHCLQQYRHDSLWKPRCIATWPELSLRSEDRDWFDCYRRKHSETITTFSDLESELKGVGWYQCPNGHLYAIGECQLAMIVSACPTCGAAVGGARHRMLASNRRLAEQSLRALMAKRDLHRLEALPGNDLLKFRRVAVTESESCAESEDEGEAIDTSLGTYLAY
eukprot:TRINITY_DN7136_c0_g1_i1.p1 TRINITY_DN7136_c0_g1~~TRINITY_DN7136_c0_g1_i1.p1  ORF type:complete len:205 (-),score=5.34 TRINITY_DN7136_c0_g1_i1:277-891(-)